VGSLLGLNAGVRSITIARDGENGYATGASAGGIPPIEFILYSIIERDLWRDVIRQERRDKGDDDLRQEGGKEMGVEKKEARRDEEKREEKTRKRGIERQREEERETERDRERETRPTHNSTEIDDERPLNSFFHI
jgi:hypothetical protein